MAEGTTIDPGKDPARPVHDRTDLQLPRRLTHLGMGLFTTFIYGRFFAHQEAVYIIGSVSSIIYIIEQIRVHYPELTEKNKFLNHSLLRKGEQFKESAALPYIMGLLLTIISFPKAVAMASILTLALADPLSAIVGIKWGSRRFQNGKSFEGSAAFFSCCFFAVAIIFDQGPFGARMALSFWMGILMTLFDQVPLKLDDNLTIPIICAFLLWPLSYFFGVPIP